MNKWEKQISLQQIFKICHVLNLKRVIFENETQINAYDSWRSAWCVIFRNEQHWLNKAQEPLNIEGLLQKLIKSFKLRGSKECRVVGERGRYYEYMQNI